MFREYRNTHTILGQRQKGDFPLNTNNTKKANSTTSTFLLYILTTVTCISLFLIGFQLYKYIKGERLYQGIQSNYTEESSNESGNGDFIIPPQIDHAGLYALNNDYVGWIRINACGIDLPIVHGKNNDEYLHTAFNHKYLYQGTLFIDCQNRSDFSDPNTIIYGHNMRNRSMFGNLRKYLNEEFAKENPTFWLCTKDYAYLYQIYSVSIVKADSNAYTLFSDFGRDYTDYINARLDASLIDFQAAPTADVRTLTLSTCYGPSGNGKRLIIQAYRKGACPEKGCSESQARENEQLQRITENRSRFF